MTEVPGNVTNNTGATANQGFMPSTQTVAFDAGWYAEDAMQSAAPQEAVDDVMLQSYDRYAASNSGAFPSFFPQVVNRNKIWAELSRFTPEQVVRLKQRLWAAGYLVYKDEKGEVNPFVAPPINPSLNDKSFIDAFNLFTQDAATEKDENGKAYTLDSLMNKAIQNRSQDIREATIAEFDLSSQAEYLQDLAEKTIGRSLREEEVQNLFNLVQSSDTSAFQLTRSMTDPFGSAANDVAYMSEPLMGGGPDSKSLNYLRSLANVYGTTVVAGWQSNTNLNVPLSLTEGRGAIIAGNLENLTRLKEWADSQKGKPDSTIDKTPLFEIVEFKYENGTDKDPTGLYLAVNDYAVAPIMAGATSNYQSFSDDAARFLQAIKRPGSSSYNWEGDGVRRGAYGLSDEIWNHYTKNVFKNIDTNDHSPAAQEAVARAYAQDLFSGDHNYRNWRQVAIAFVKNEQAALAEREGRANEGDAFVNVLLNDDDRLRLTKIMENIGNPAFIPGATVGTDPYTMMYGESGMGVPTVSDPYAGRPRNDMDFRNKATNKFRKDYSGQRLSAASFNKIISVLQDYDSSALGGVE